MNQTEYYAGLTASEINLAAPHGYEYDNTSPSDFRYNFVYHAQYPELLRAYPLADIAGNGTTFEQALNLMNWLSEKTFYCGNSRLGKNDLSSIIGYSFDKGWEGAINCEHKATLLQEFLIALHHFAHIICFERYCVNDSNTAITSINCHVCVHLYLPEENKWILLDPSFGTYFTDKNGKKLNIVEIQETLRRKEDVQVCNYSLNGTEIFRKGYPVSFIYNMAFRISLRNGNRKEDLVYNQNLLFPTDVNKKNYYRMKQTANGMSEHEIDDQIPHVRYITADELLCRPSWS